MTTSTEPVTNHVLAFIHAADAGDFTEALTHFDDDAVVVAADVNDGVPLDMPAFREMIDVRQRELEPSAPRPRHLIDAVLSSPQACIVEGFVDGLAQPKFFLCSAKLGVSGRIRRYTFLTWVVDEATRDAIRR